MTKIGSIFELNITEYFENGKPPKITCRTPMIVCAIHKGCPDHNESLYLTSSEYESKHHRSKTHTSYKIYIVRHSKSYIALYYEYEKSYYIVKPLDNRDFLAYVAEVDPTYCLSEKELARFYPRVEHEDWFRRWTDINYIAPDTSLKAITGVPELLWPFMQDIPDDDIADRFAMFNIVCKNKIEFPLDMNKVECVLLMGRKIQLFIGDDVMREGELRIRQLDDRYELL